MDHIRVSDKTRKSVEKILRHEETDPMTSLVVILIVIVVAILAILLTI